jgi:dethiobiotin synthetase
MPKGFFITGTDTGVGKTVITAALIRTAGIIGLRVCGMKPIETGCQKSEHRSKEGILLPSDGMFLREMAGMQEPLDLVTPVRFENPLSPLSASGIEGRTIDLEKIKKAFTCLAENYDAVIVEGIGGLLVPIKRDYFVLDLARDFGLPLIVVSSPGLGTINHSMLTVRLATQEGLTVAGIIMNYSRTPEGNLAERTNPEAIEQVSPVPLIGIFPHLRDLGKTTVEQAAVKNLDLKIIRKYL